MVFQFIKNREETNLTQYDFDVLEIIKNPQNKKKEDCPLWNFVSLFEGCDKKRNQENYENIFAFILDFDDNVSIREFKDRYAKFNYYLYTTTSHSKDQDKFRVIMPLKTPVKHSEIRNNEVREALVGFFEGVDVSSFRNFHNLPNLPSKDPSDYYWCFNKSEEFFSLDILKDDIRKIGRKKSLEKMKNATRSVGKSYSCEMSEYARAAYKRVVENNFEKAMLEIPCSKSGDRYNKLVSFVGKMMTAKYPDDEHIFELHEIQNLVYQNSSDKNVKNMISNFWRR